MRNGAAILFNSMFYAHSKPKKFYSDNNFIFASIDRKDQLADNNKTCMNTCTHDENLTALFVTEFMSGPVRSQR